MDVRVPNLGDIDEVEVTELCVSVGDLVGENDPIIVIESDKASMEVPAGVAGVIQSFAISLGDVVGEGSLIAHISVDAEETVAESETQKPSVDESKTEAPIADVGSPASVSDVAASTADESPSSTNQKKDLDVLVPDLGDIDEVEVIEIGIAVGDSVSAGDLLLVLESDKASMEIPAEVGGEVIKLAVAVGDQVSAGSLIAVIATTDAGNVALVSENSAGLGSKSKQTKRESKEDKTESVDAKGATNAPTKKPEASPSLAETAAASASAVDKNIYAGPAVRRLARELGVDLAAITGTGNRGRLTKDDVKIYVKSQLKQESAGSGAGVTGGAGFPALPEIDFSRFGEIEAVPLSRIQKQVAVNMHRSWLNVPHVTQHGKADITELEAFRKGLKPEAAARELSLTPLAFLVRACCHALEAYPKFNSSLHSDGSQIIVKKYMHIGIAVDTPGGLVVPVIRDANKMGIWQLCEAIGSLAEKARNKKLAMDDLSGGTFTISSLGAIGGTGFTPIVNTPEVAILGVANSAMEPFWDGAEFSPKLMLPLSLSYDHRVINGVDGGQFMLLLSQILGDIRRLAL
ncbi:dihydrolipoyllysine-residue acetyltransferase [Pseudomonadales bacterium]|nr:dihydrolipoyllysine-residue acetyltransferase [Pseudomonadales bacterium]